jgi:hypothetical protein
LIKAVQRPVFAVWNAWIICGHPECPVNLSQAQTAQAAVALDRNELGALLVAAGLGPPAGHALISLLALNGLGVSEATGADIEHLGLERGTGLWSSPERAAKW